MSHHTRDITMFCSRPKLDSLQEVIRYILTMCTQGLIFYNVSLSSQLWIDDYMYLLQRKSSK